MTDMTNFTIEELKMLPNVRKVDSYENMSRQQLECLFIMSLAPATTPCLP